jgi:hypothetical protein
MQAAIMGTYPKSNEAKFKVYRQAMVGKKFWQVIQAGISLGHPLPHDH